MDPDRSLRLGRLLTGVVAGLRFGEVVDSGPLGPTGPIGGAPRPGAAPIAHTPNIDTAVVELDAEGRPLAAANVLLSRDHPGGIAVAVGADLATRAVRWWRWDQARWDGGRFSEDGRRTAAVGWDDDPPFTGDDDLLADRDAAPISFMEPYPASVFKLPVAFHVLRLADAGLIDLDRPLGAPGATPRGPATRRHLDAMITASDNEAARALLRHLHDLHEVDGLNAAFRELGLGTLGVQGTDPATGGRWQVGRITATSLDLARLLLLVRGAPGPLWRTPDGRAVGAGILSPSSRELLMGLLAEQGWNDVLSTSSWCGGFDPARGDPGQGPDGEAEPVTAGIPARVAPRWIDPVTGAVTVGDERFGGDVRPCNAGAEVVFAHKTGFTSSFLADAGIVEPLPGHRERRYIVAVLSNLGSRFSDRRFVQSRRTTPGRRVPYTEQLAILGRSIDRLLPLEAPEGAPPSARSAQGAA